MPRSTDDAFGASRARFDEVCSFMGDEDAMGLTHGELEARLAVDVRELVRHLLQDHLDLRAGREKRLGEVIDDNDIPRKAVEAGHTRPLVTIFGKVTVTRFAYRRRAEENLYPADAVLNLPEEAHSHGLRELAAIESARGSFEDATDAIHRATGVSVGKRQVEELTRRAAVDFEAFYEQRPAIRADDGDVLVLSVDGKGIVMRPEALRPQTAKAAGKATSKLKTRLSKGEKRNRKRIAEVGTVYHATPIPRAASDIIGPPKDAGKVEGPKAKNKWLTASVVDDASEVITAVFEEACRRDPAHTRTWVALVDGANHQIDCIEAEAARRDIEITIVVDFVHALEYLWSAAWSFFAEGDAGAEEWVADKAIAVLEGKASTVAASIRRKATCLGLDARRRANADTCADYLLAKRDYLDYPRALREGWPIATGVIEGAVRHLVKDRMDVTGARWGLEGAEAVLKLRAVRSNGDSQHYFNFHLNMERQRVHEARYANAVIPMAA
jgi:hypothetical protein